MIDCTKEDAICLLLLFCVTFGVGSLTMGRIFAADGLIWGAIMLYSVSVCNIHASVQLSKCLLEAPPYVRTYGDLGYYLHGNLGKWIVILTQHILCYLTPIAFLILGGTELLPYVFKEPFPHITKNQWILIMGLIMVPIVSIRTLKETAYLCVFGGIGAIVADLIVMEYSIEEKSYFPRSTSVHYKNVILSFGELAFAFGLANVVPAIQRQHPQPNNMPRLLTLVNIVITIIYALIGIFTYIQYGCTAPSNLLLELPDITVWKKVCYGCMTIHLCMAFPLQINPLVFMIERALFGKDLDLHVLQTYVYKNIVYNRDSIALIDQDESNKELTKYHTQDKFSSSYASKEYETTQNYLNHVLHDESSFHFTWKESILSTLFRITLVFSQALIAIGLQSSFQEILTFTGGCATAINCFILPCLFIHSMASKHSFVLDRSTKILNIFTIIFCLTLSLICALQTFWNMENYFISNGLFSNYHFPKNEIHSNETETDRFPFCEVGQRN